MNTRRSSSESSKSPHRRPSSNAFGISPVSTSTASADCKTTCVTAAAAIPASRFAPNGKSVLAIAAITALAAIEEKTYRRLLRLIGSKKRRTSVECLFVDPLSDIAVLGSPDNETFSEESTRYEKLVESVKPVSIGDTVKEGERLWMLGLDGKFKSATCLGFSGSRLWLRGADVKPGISGSPILNEKGLAVGVCNLGRVRSAAGGAAGSDSGDDSSTRLVACLPAGSWSGDDVGS